MCSLVNKMDTPCKITIHNSKEHTRCLSLPKSIPGPTTLTVTLQGKSRSDNNPPAEPTPTTLPRPETNHPIAGKSPATGKAHSKRAHLSLPASLSRRTNPPTATHITSQHITSQYTTQRTPSIAEDVVSGLASVSGLLRFHLRKRVSQPGDAPLQPVGHGPGTCVEVRLSSW